MTQDQKDALLALVQGYIDAAVAAAGQVGGPDPLQAQLDQAKADLASAQVELVAVKDHSDKLVAAIKDAVAKDVKLIGDDIEALLNPPAPPAV